MALLFEPPAAQGCYANGDVTGRSLAESQAACPANAACKAVVCPAGQTTHACTLRSNCNTLAPNCAAHSLATAYPHGATAGRTATTDS
eukprot:gene35737-51822_t